jgi:predicted dehydrogenase
MSSGERASPAGPGPVLRVGVVGGGFVAQAVHLPWLAELSRRFAVVALADPSPRVRERLGARYGIARLYPDHRRLLEHAALDAVLVCSPNATHAATVLDALAAGLHVLVEKPLCLSAADARRIVAARDRVGRVVQVGYMKRFDPAYEAMLADMASARGVLHAATLTYDPWLPPSFAPADYVAPEAAPAGTDPAAAAQVAEAAGTDDPAHVVAFSDVLCGALVHDVNAMLGLLDAAGAADGIAVADASCSAGPAASATVALEGGARWTMAWLSLPGLGDFSERLAVYARDAVRELSFPAPYLRQAPTGYAVRRGGGAGHVVRVEQAWVEPYRRQLEHFHDCIVSGIPCRTGPEAALRDLELLAGIFRAHLAQAPRQARAAA